MGCCNLEEPDKEISGVTLLARKLFFLALHGLYISFLSVMSIFRKEWKPVLSFYKKYYSDIIREIG